MGLWYEDLPSSRQRGLKMSKQKPNIFKEVFSLHDSCKEQLEAMEKPIEEFRRLRIDTVLPPEKKEKVERLVSTLEADIKTYRTDADTLKEQHKHWKGRPKRPNQHMDAFAVGNEYVALNDRIMATALPLSIELTEVIDDALKTAIQGNENE